MRRFLLFALFALVPLACSTQTASQSAKQEASNPEEFPPPVEGGDTGKEKQTKDGWVALFNGKDLTGWKTHPDAPGKWVVENGVLIGNSPELSFLYSNRDDYENFHVRMEAKVSEKCDSGLFFRAQMPSGDKGKKAGKKGDPADPAAKKAGKKADPGGGGGKGFGPGNPTGYEAQINNDAKGMGGALTGTLMIGQGGGGGKGTTYSEKLVNADQWFTLEVIADGSRIKILVNGKETVDYNSSSATKAYSKGHFAIQSKKAIQDGGAGGGKAKKAAPGEGKTYDQIIYVRKLEVKELPSVSGK